MIIFTSRGKNFSEFPFRNFWPWNWRGCFVKIFNWEYKINKFIFFLKGQSELKAFQFLKHKTLLPRLQSFSQGRGQIFLWCRKEDGSFGQDEECWLKWTRKSLKKIRLKEWWGGYWHPWNQLGTSQNPLCDNTQVFKWKERGDTGSLDFSVNFDQLIHKNHLHFCSCQTIWGESTHEVCEDQRRDKVSQKSEKNKRRKWK